MNWKDGVELRSLMKRRRMWEGGVGLEDISGSV